MYVPITRKIISSYDVVFDESLSTALEHTSQPYAEAMDISMSASYITYVKYPSEKTSNRITLAQFEEGDLLSKTQNILSYTCDNTEIGKKYDDD